MNFPGQKFIVLVMMMTIFFFSERAFSQYDDAQIKFVIEKLKAKNLLGNLIELTQADSRQSATRADVLFACYLVVRYLDDNSDIAGLNQKLIQLQNSIKNLERPTGRVTTSEEVLVQRVVEQVEKKLSARKSSEDTNKELNELRNTIDEMKTAVKNAQPQKYNKLEQKVNNNTIIASAAVVLSLVITIFAAR